MSRHCSARRSGRPKSIVCCTGFLLAALLFCSVSRGSVAAPLAPNSLNLQEARVSVAYRHVLDGALARLKTWCAVQGEEQPETFCNDAFQMADLLVRHVQYLYENQFGVSAARQCILAVQTKYRHLRGKLTKSWDSVKSWEMIAPISLRVPVPFMILDAMFATALLRGFHATGTAARDYISFAVCLLLGFHSLLRPGELAILTPRKIALPDARLHTLVTSGLVTITNGKNRRVFGRVQIASLCDSRCIAWLSWLMAGMDLDARLLPGGDGKFRSIFAQIVKDLDIQDMGLTPASLRAGGATHYLSTGILDLGQLKFRGRWAALSTLEHYVQECTATLVMLRLADSTLDRLESLIRFSAKFKLPPATPWERFFPRPRQRASSNGFAGRRAVSARRRSHSVRELGVPGVWSR